MKTSEQTGQLMAALAAAQGAMAHASRDSANPHFRSRFASLASCVDACRGPLAQNGLAIVQAPSRRDTGSVVLVTRLGHASGEWIETELEAMPREDTPQAVGSVITYLRRYMLLAVTGLAPDDDDDGNAASAGAPRAAASAPPPARTPPPAQRSAPAAEDHAARQQRVRELIRAGRERASTAEAKARGESVQGFASWLNEVAGCALVRANGLDLDALTPEVCDRLERALAPAAAAAAR